MALPRVTIKVSLPGDVRAHRSRPEQAGPAPSPQGLPWPATLLPARAAGSGRLHSPVDVLVKRVIGGKGEETPEAHTQGVEDLKSSLDPHLWQGRMQMESKEKGWHAVALSRGPRKEEGGGGAGARPQVQLTAW